MKSIARFMTGESWSSPNANARLTAISVVGKRDLMVESIEWKRPQEPSACCSVSNSFAQG